MLKAIVASTNAIVNPYDELTIDERPEFDAWLDDCKADVRDPLPEDFTGIYAEQAAYDTFRDEASETEWETLKANTKALMIANGQLADDSPRKPVTMLDWLDSLPESCQCDPIDNGIAILTDVDMVADDDFPIDDDDMDCPFEDGKPYTWRKKPNGEIEILYSRLHLKSQIRFIEFTATPPASVRKALENGHSQYRWGQSFIYFRHHEDARRYRDAR